MYIRIGIYRSISIIYTLSYVSLGVCNKGRVCMDCSNRGREGVP